MAMKAAQPPRTVRIIKDIKETACALGPETCRNFLFVHAILGCDTTSALYGLGKGQALRKLASDDRFGNQAEIFDKADASKDETIAAGEKSLVLLYKGQSDDTLDSLRYAKFCQKISTGNSFVQPECLPPTSAAASYHSLRVYHQVQGWKGVALPAENWGWKLEDDRLLPVRTSLPAAHASLLEMVRCGCKTDCMFMQKTRARMFRCVCLL